MKPHPLTAFRTWQPRQAEVAHRGQRFPLSCRDSDGEAILALVYPDPVQASRECRHAAAVNGRSKPYPQEAFVLASAIQLTLQSPDDCEPMDLVGLLAIFDGAPDLFQRLGEAAFRVLGLETEPAVGGFETWSTLLKQLDAGQVEAARQLVLTTLRSLRPPVEEFSFDVSLPLVETHLGKS